MLQMIIEMLWFTPFANGFAFGRRCELVCVHIVWVVDPLNKTELS